MKNKIMLISSEQYENLTTFDPAVSYVINDNVNDSSDIMAALDTKINSVSTSNVLYGTAADGSQTVYTIEEIVNQCLNNLHIYDGEIEEEA